MNLYFFALLFLFSNVLSYALVPVSYFRHLYPSIYHSHRRPTGSKHHHPRPSANVRRKKITKYSGSSEVRNLVSYSPNHYMWPLHRQIGRSFCRKGQEFTCKPCQKCTPTTTINLKRSLNICRTPCGQAETIMFHKLSESRYAKPQRVFLSSIGGHLHQPGVFLVAINPDHAFFIESDGNNNFKIFQAFSLLYSYQWWVNQEGDTLCGLYNNEATALGWHKLDINRLQRVRDRYGKKQVINGLSDFFRDIANNVSRARSLVLLRSKSHMPAMLTNDVYSLPSMHYIFGASMINFAKYFARHYYNIETRVYFRRAL